MALKTLAEMNANLARSESGKYTLQPEYGVGRRGRGEELHLVFTNRVVADADPQPGTYRVGQVYSTLTPCNGNGQHTARLVRGCDTKDITCKRCLAYLGEGS